MSPRFRARNHFQLEEAPSSGDRAVGSTHTAYRSGSEVSLLPDLHVPSGPGQRSPGGKVLSDFIPASPTCSHGAQTDHHDTVYWLTLHNDPSSKQKRGGKDVMITAKEIAARK